MLYLMIQNKGVAPVEAFTTLGATTKRDSDVAGLIGHFGSGANMGTLTLLREGINPVVYAGKTRLEFFTKPITVTASDGRAVEHQLACITINKKSRELGWTLAHGEKDWGEVAYSLREYVSNAIDAVLLSGVSVTDVKKHVKLEIVDEGKVRARDGYTRVFVPVTREVQKFYANLGRWFLHFSEPGLLCKSVLYKNGRNIASGHPGEVPSQRAVIYRRGVRVREFESDYTPSLFDYNLDDLDMDESRTVDDWKVMYAAGRALRKASRHELSEVFEAMSKGTNYWEVKLSSYGLTPDWRDTEDDLAEIKTEWEAALKTIAGDDGVMVPKEAQSIREVVAKKGYEPLSVPSGWMEAAEKLGVTTDKKVVTDDEKISRTYSDATATLIGVVDWIWGVLEEMGETHGRPKPACGCFTEPLKAGSQTWGLYRDGKVLLHTEIASEATDMMTWVCLEETAHHITQATDLSRDFQTFLVRLASRLMLRG